MSKFKTIKKYAVIATTAAILSACGGSGNCPTDKNINNPLTLQLTAPNQYPAGVPVTAYLTLTNNSKVDANNLFYQIPEETNHTGTTITIENGANQPCTTILTGKSCTFPVQITNNPASHPGSFTVTATPNGFKQNTKTLARSNSKSLQDTNTLSLTANIGLTEVEANNESGANGITFLYAQKIAQNPNGDTLLSVVAVVNSLAAGDKGNFNTINLTDASGNKLNFVMQSGNSGTGLAPLGLGSVVTYLLTIPAGVSSYQFYAQTMNDNTLVDQATQQQPIDLLNAQYGILVSKPTEFSLNANYPSQLVTYTNIGGASVSGINITPSSGLTISDNTCNNITLQSGASCTYSVSFDASNPIAGTGSIAATYNNGATNVEVDSVVQYRGRDVLAGLTLTSANNPNFNFFAQTESPSVAATVNIKNTGVESVTLTGYTPPAHFAINSSTCPTPTTLSANQSCNVTLTYTNPDVTPLAYDNAVVNYTYKGINGVESAASSEVVLTYQTVQSSAAISVNPNPISFAQIIGNGTESNTQTVTITNTGLVAANSVNLAITGTNASYFSIQSTNCSATISAGASCFATIKFGTASVESSVNTSANLSIDYVPYASATAITQNTPLNGYIANPRAAIFVLSSPVFTGLNNFFSGNGTESAPYLMAKNYNSGSVTATYTITNIGASAANNVNFYNGTYWEMTASTCGDYYEVISPSYVTIPANSSCSITLTLTQPYYVGNYYSISPANRFWLAWNDETKPNTQGNIWNGDYNEMYFTDYPNVYVNIFNPLVINFMLLQNSQTNYVPSYSNESYQAVFSSTGGAGNPIINASLNKSDGISIESGNCTSMNTPSCVLILRNNNLALASANPTYFNSKYKITPVVASVSPSQSYTNNVAESSFAVTFKDPKQPIYYNTSESGVIVYVPDATQKAIYRCTLSGYSFNACSVLFSATMLVNDTDVFNPEYITVSNSNDGSGNLYITSGSNVYGISVNSHTGQYANQYYKNVMSYNLSNTVTAITSANTGSNMLLYITISGGGAPSYMCNVSSSTNAINLGTCNSIASGFSTNYGISGAKIATFNGESYYLYYTRTSPTGNTEYSTVNKVTGSLTFAGTLYNAGPNDSAYGSVVVESVPYFTFNSTPFVFTGDSNIATVGRVSYFLINTATGDYYNYGASPRGGVYPTVNNLKFLDTNYFAVIPNGITPPYGQFALISNKWTVGVDTNTQYQPLAKDVYLCNMNAQYIQTCSNSKFYLPLP